MRHWEFFLENLRKQKKATLKEMLLDETIKLFSQKGIQNVSLVEITDKFFVHPRTFLRYFGTKEDAAFAWFERIQLELVTFLRRISPEHFSRDIVVDTLLTLAQVLEKDRETLLSIEKIIRATPKLEMQRTEWFHRWKKTFLTFLNGILAESEVFEVSVIVSASMGVLEYTFCKWISEDKPRSLRKLVEDGLRVLSFRAN